MVIDGQLGAYPEKATWQCHSVNQQQHCWWSFLLCHLKTINNGTMDKIPKLYVVRRPDVPFPFVSDMGRATFGQP
jgi:hypothetical protein